MADRTAPKPRRDDALDPIVIVALGRQQVVAEGPAQRRRLRLAREHLGRPVDRVHVVPARDEPEADRLDPRDRLLLAQARIDRVRVAFQVGDADGRPDRGGLAHALLLTAASSYDIELSAASPTTSRALTP